MRRSHIMLVLASLFVLAGCNNLNKDIPVSSVNIFKEQITVDEADYLPLSYEILPEDATNKEVTWKSSAPSIAKIENGVVRGVSVGEATITIKTKDGGKTDTCKVKVTEREPDIKENTLVGEFYGGIVEGSEYTGYEFSKSPDRIVKPSSGIGEINVYTFNDFHGAVVEQDDEIGLKRFGTFIKDKSIHDNTLIFDQGDTWQGSFESNYSYGSIINDVFNYANVSLRTVGNHDFDWGLSHLQENVEAKSGDDYIPTLAANVYDYADGVNGNVQQSQYGKEYATFVLDNGIKIGVVGVIGDGQITSISSQIVDTICFTDHIQKIKEISDFLRVSKKCDVVIASAHEGSYDMADNGEALTQISPISGKRYIDLALCGHTHRNAERTYEGVKFLEAGSNGQFIKSAFLKYDFSKKKILDDRTDVQSYNSYDISQAYPTIETTINAKVNDYLASIEDVGNEVLSTHFQGYFERDVLSRIMTKAIYNRVSSQIQYNDLSFACCNEARTYFSTSSTHPYLTYRDLYKCFPFDNQIIIMDVSSQYGRNNIGWNYAYREDTCLNPHQNGTYKCAIIDYIAMHQNENREFDKFPDATSGYTVFNDGVGDPPIYREILRSYLLAHQDETFNPNDYNASADQHFVS